MKKQKNVLPAILMLAVFLTACTAEKADGGPADGFNDGLFSWGKGNESASSPVVGGIGTSQSEANSPTDSLISSPALPPYTPVNPDNVPESSSGDFTYVDMDSVSKSDPPRISITGYIGTAAQVKIPAQIDGKTVSHIGEKAFEKNETITYVYLPDTVTFIGNYAFRNCASLQEVRLSNNTERIPKGCFESCSALRYTEIPEGCRYIEGDRDHGAFLECVSLTDVVFPSTLEYLSTEAFYGCTSLESVDLSHTSVSSIYQLAFAYCTSLKSVSLPATLTSGTSSNIFTGCISLAEITMVDGNPDAAIIDGVLYMRDTLLLRAPAHPQTDVVIREGTTTIDFAAFKYNENLRSVVIPDSVTEISRQSFMSCPNLESVTLGNGISSIGQDAFSSCSSLKSIVLPDSVKHISLDAFSYCSSLESINIPDNAEYSSGETSAKIFRNDEKVNITYKGNTYTYEQLAELDKAMGIAQ